MPSEGVSIISIASELAIALTASQIHVFDIGLCRDSAIASELAIALTASQIANL